jgi:uracil-DNA glycosylase family 4
MICKTILTCTRCPLHFTRRKVVIGRGVLPANLCFVGEGPGYTEDMIGQAFIGVSGKLLDQMCIDAGLNSFTKFFTNIVLCHPTDRFAGPNRDPSYLEVCQCMENLNNIILRCNPWLIVLVGGIAAKYFKSSGLTIRTIKIQHPAYLLESGGKQSPYYIQNVRRLEEIHELI